MRQTDTRYVHMVYDTQQGLSQEHEMSSISSALLRNSDSRGGVVASLGLSRDLQGKVPVSGMVFG